MKQILNNRVFLCACGFILGLAIIIIGIVLMQNGQHGKKVTVLSVDGTEITRGTKENGKEVLLPDNPRVPEGWVFSEWKIAESFDEAQTIIGKNNPIRATKNDGEDHVYAIAQGTQIPKDKTVLAMSGGYGTKGNTITLPIQLCGKVDTCAFEIEIDYDPKCLQFIESVNDDYDVVLNNSEEGKILVNYLTSVNTTGDVLLTELKFEIKSSEKQFSDIGMKVKNGTKIDDNGNIADVSIDAIEAKVEIV